MKIKQLSLAVALATTSHMALSAPGAPQISWQPQEYSFVEVDQYGTGGYKSLVERFDEININIEWVVNSGEGGESYKVYFDDQLVNEGSFAAGTKSGTIEFPYQQSGRHTMYVELCDETGCTRSAGKELVIADTDGSHLPPLQMDVDANNNNYGIKQDTVMGAYFVEWSIYDRDFDVSNIPAQNLSHIIYGFIPICGENASLPGSSKAALNTACQGSQDYEVVIHDPWAAIQKALPGMDSNEQIRGTYGQIMALKQRYPDLKILPSIGGWTLSDPFYGFTDKANRDTFVASVKEFLKTWKFYDGVDIDWEYPGGQGANPNLGDPANDGAAYVALMQELRAMLDELEAESGREYELTSAIGAGHDKLEDVDYAQAEQYMDYIFIMAYDYYGGFSNVTGHQAALYCGSHFRPGQCDGTGVDENGQPYAGPAYTTHNAVQTLLAQNVPSQKLVVGAAMYGRGWEGVYPENATIADNPMSAPADGKFQGSTAMGVWEAGVIDYKGIKEYILGPNDTGINGYETGYDAQAEAAWVWNRSNGKLLTYDNRRSVLAKGAYVQQYNLGGLFAWEIDADNGDILNAMHDSLGDVPPANGKPVLTVDQQVSVLGGSSIVIDATATDRDGDALTFAWQADSALTLENADSASVTVSAPAVTQDTQYTATVSVSDSTDTVSKVVTVTVLAEPTQGNSAPTVATINDATLDEGQSLAVNVQASDADGDSLTYSWNVPAGLTLSGSGADVTISAGEVSADTSYSVSVDVSDGSSTTTESFNITVLDTDTTDPDPQPSGNWDSNAVYVKDDVVTYNGIEYKAKWWTQGDQPDLGGPWEAQSQPTDGNGDVVWSSQAIYNGGDIVTHQGERYEAKWWTQGEEPGVAAVWNLL